LAPLSALSTLRFSLVLAVATTVLRCGGSQFTVAGDDSGSSVGQPDTSVSDDGAAAGDDADDSSLTTDGWTPETGGVKDAHADAPHADAPSDAPSDQTATDAPVIRDAAIDIAACASICTGCCDATGHCQAGNSQTVCGQRGALCANCATRVCPVSEFGCCTTAGACGCAIGSLVGCM
jgi:hypothetical protein